MAIILIANADHRFSQMLKTVLGSYGHTVVIARTGEETIHRFEEHAPAVVLLDLAILGLSGLDVLAQLKARSPHLPVVVVTGEVPIEVEDRAREMGITDVLRKRLKMDVIMQAVNHALQEAGRPAMASLAPAASAAGGGQAATILIVDDEREICDLLSEFLQRRGYRTKVAYSGEEALGKIKQEPPDLVLLDVYMPGLNGVEVLRRLVNSQFAGGIIILTASQDNELLKTALDLGAFDVLSKPVALDQVELAVMVKLAMSEPVPRLT